MQQSGKPLNDLCTQADMCLDRLAVKHWRLYQTMRPIDLANTRPKVLERQSPIVVPNLWRTIVVVVSAEAAARLPAEERQQRRRLRHAHPRQMQMAAAQPVR